MKYYVCALLMASLLAGCTTTPEEPVLSKEAVRKVTPSSSVIVPENLEVPVRLRLEGESSQNNRELATDGSSYEIEGKNSSLGITFAPGLYVEVYEKVGGKVTRKPAYAKTPQDNNRTLYINLKDITADTDWFVVNSEEKLDEDQELVAAGLTRMAEHNSAVVIKPQTWRIFSVRKTGKWQWTSQLAAGIEVQQVPFSLEMMVQKPGQREPIEFIPEKDGDIPAGSKLKISLNAYRDTHMGVFLCYLKGQSTEKIVRLFPASQDDQTPEVEQGTPLEIPGEEDFVTLDNFPGRRAIFCFPSDKSLACAEIENWLATNATKTRGPAGIEKIPEAAIGRKNINIKVFRVDSEKYQHMRIDLNEVEE